MQVPTANRAPRGRFHGAFRGRSTVLAVVAWGLLALAGPVAAAPPPLVISTVDSMDDVGEFTSIAIGDDGLPVMSYLDFTDGTVNVAHCNSSDCNSTDGYTITAIDSVGGFDSYTGIAIGTDGFPVVSYRDASGNLRVAHCNAADCNATAGATLSMVDTGASRYTAIAIGSDGLPVVAYHEDLSDDLKVAHCNAVDCNPTDGATLTVLDTTGDVGEYVSIAIGVDGLPILSYQDDTLDEIRAAHCNAVDCNSAAGFTLSVVSSSGSLGAYSSIAIGSDGLPIISYREESDPGFFFLEVAHCGSVRCDSAGGYTLTRVDGEVGTGFHTSIAIGQDGLPIISYRDQMNGDLKVTQCNSVDCNSMAGFSSTTLDGPDDVGAYTSIAIGLDGLPVISYRDETNADLKVARCANLGCRAPLFDEDFETGDTSGWTVTVP